MKAVSEALRRSGQGQGGVGNADLGGGGGEVANFETLKGEGIEWGQWAKR